MPQKDKGLRNPRNCEAAGVHPRLLSIDRGAPIRSLPAATSFLNCQLAASFPLSYTRLRDTSDSGSNRGGICERLFVTFAAAAMLGSGVLAGQSFSPVVKNFVSVSDPAVVLQHVRVIDGTGAAP